MDLRKEAEERALRAEQAAVSEENRRASFRSRYSEVQQNRRQSIKLEMKVNEEDYSSHENETPKIAQLAEIDYKWNGSRAKNGGNFVLPRWVPDEEIMYCHACNSEFDFINRKHHCRHCGMVYCDNCSQNKVLLPHEYGYRDPVRVCNDCNDKMVPLQQYLSTNIANHQRVNNIDIASTNCNVRRYMNMPFSSTLGSEIRKAAYSTHNLFSQPLHFVRDKAIPLRLLANAQGLAFITMIKGGFIFAPRLGTGLVVSRLPESEGGGWSAPTAIATMGLSWGALIGLDVTDYVIVLNTPEAVAAFSGLGQITIGAGIEVAVGPVGRSGSADFHIGDKGLAPAFSYSHSRGLFAGLSLDGSVILARNDVNHCFYGRPVTPTDLLSGAVPPPRAAAPLYDALAEALSALPDVQHVRRPPGAGVGQGDGARRASLAPTAPGAGADAGEDSGNTAQTIRDIDALLNPSQDGNLTSSASSARASGRDPHRRRTMMAFPSAQEPGAVMVVEDDVWGVSSTYSAAPPASQEPAWHPAEEDEGVPGAWVGDNSVPAASARPDHVPRPGRPRSLPETRSDAIGAQYSYRPRPTGPTAEEMLVDVPKPPTNNSAEKGAAVSSSSLIDEELECVTANVNALL